MNRPIRHLAIAAAVLTAGLHLAPAGAAASPDRFPVPEADPFYAVPKNIGTYRNGDVIASRPIKARMLELPLPVYAWQVKYRTENRRGRPTATVTTVLRPRADWRGAGARPLLSYQTAEDGVAGRCAPSYALRAGIRGGLTGSYQEIPLIAMALRRGWTVTVPDYEGPRSEFLVAGMAAHGVLDAIRATRRFRPARVAPRAPTGMWGYSGGSFATVVAAQAQPRYAPGLRIDAVALGGLVGDIRATIDAFSGSIGGGAIPMGINGFLRAYPGLNLLQYLNDSGDAKVRATAADCIFDAAPRYPFLRVSQIEAYPGAMDAPPVERMLRQNSPRYRRGSPTAPVYHYHARLDEFAPIGPARAVVRRFCRAGVPVERDEKLLGEHLTEIALGAPGALRFLGRRFAGRPATDDCGGRW